jgi:hypothetical protein
MGLLLCLRGHTLVAADGGKEAVVSLLPAFAPPVDQCAGVPFAFLQPEAVGKELPHRHHDVRVRLVDQQSAVGILPGMVMIGRHAPEEIAWLQRVDRNAGGANFLDHPGLKLFLGIERCAIGVNG